MVEKVSPSCLAGGAGTFRKFSFTQAAAHRDFLDDYVQSYSTSPAKQMEMHSLPFTVYSHMEVHRLIEVYPPTHFEAEACPAIINHTCNSLPPKGIFG